MQHAYLPAMVYPGRLKGQDKNGTGPEMSFADVNMQCSPYHRVKSGPYLHPILSLFIIN